MRAEAQVTFDVAVCEYASQWTDWRQSVGDDDGYGVEEQSVVVDAVKGFFHQFPSWKQWATELCVKKAEVRRIVADFVYEAITTGRVDF